MPVIFQNYHRHSNYSIITHGGDSVVRNEEYAQRAIELGHTIISGVEHGFAGRHIEGYDLAKKYGLKFLFGAEAYFVKNRFDKDRSNNHIVLLAKNENGRKALNVALSEAFTSGYYYVPRLDLNLLLNLPSKDIWITSACFPEWASVKTTLGYRKITDLEVGDFVLSHDGTYKKVNKLTTREYNDNLINIKFKKQDNTISSTKDHKYLILENDVLIWKESNKLKIGDICLYPLNYKYTNIREIDIKKENNVFLNSQSILSKRNMKVIPDKIILSDEFLMSVGLWLADGYFYENKKNGSSKLGFSFNLNEFKKYFSFVERGFSQFGIEPYIYENKESNKVDVSYSSKMLVNAFSSLFDFEKGKSHTKRISRRLMEISQTASAAILYGYLLGDGYFRYRKKYGGEVVSASVSKNLSYDILELYRQIFLNPTITKNNAKTGKDNVNHRDSYYITLSNSEIGKLSKSDILSPKSFLDVVKKRDNKESFIKIGETTYLKKQIERITFSDEIEKNVYCLNVDKNNSFVCEDVIVHNCLGGWKYEDSDYVWLTLAEHFGENFFFEVQAHNTDSQKQLNSHILNLSKETGIKTIFGCDSHYIFSHQAKDRENYLASKGIVYEDEVGWYMDYPDGDEVVRRFKEQGVLSEEEIMESIDNTNVFLEVEEYNSPVYTKEIKMPTLHPEKTKEEKDAIYENLIWDRWSEEKKKINPELWGKYEEEIKKEVAVVKNIGHADYFLLDYEIVKRGKEKGGVITSTGRGSGVSYYTCKLLDLTKIDRISSPVKLYPERFLSETRILETKSLADLDLNLANPEVFAEAQKEILGEEHSYPMIAWGTMRAKEAWKMYSRANHIDFETANEVSGQIEDYEFALKHAEEDDEILIDDYVDNKYLKLVKESSRYLGIYSNVKIHPCATLIAPFNIKEEAGLIAMRAAKGTVNVCTLIDGLWAEKNKMLKNDLLKVNVVELYSRVYKRIGMDDTHDVNELWEIAKKDDSIWDIYRKGAVIGINQVEQTGTAKRVMKYAPKNISELSAFVAAVRPGFASMYDIFESRQHFDYGIEAFDKLVQTEELPHSFVLYQEQAMAAMNFAGIPMDRTYEIVKSIAKKRYDDVFSAKEQFISGFYKVTGSMETSQKIWQILEDSSRYSFNSSHSLSVATDSLYTAYLKAHYPLFFYEQLLQILEEKGEKDRLLRAKAEAQRHFKISFPAMKFGQDNTKILANEKTNEITMSMSTLKGFGNSVSESLLELSNKFEGKGIVDLFVFAIENGFFSASKWEKLIMIGYFSEFGGGKKVINFFNEFTKGKSKYGTKLKDNTKIKRIQELRDIWNNLEDVDFSVGEKIRNEVSVIGEVRSRFPVDKRYFFVLEVSDEESGNPYSPRVLLHSLKSGYADTLKISKKIYQPVKAGDIIFCHNFEKKPAVKKVDGEWVNIPETFNWWMTDYEKLSEARVITMSEEQ